jgi:hypothetical protein
MDQPDDPEARIRDLERPLTDPAPAAELPASDVSGDGCPRSMPPVIQGGPSSSTPPRPWGMRSRWGRLVSILICLVIAWLSLVRLIDNLGRLVGGSHSSTPHFGPAWVPSHSNLPDIPTPSSTASDTATPYDPVRVTGTNVSQTISCDSNGVTISGSSNTITVKGHCTWLWVPGDRNVVTVDTADDIDVVGSHNDITYTTGQPKTENTGESSTIHPAAKN